mmetsp:Transcript_40286/g.60429  ORF Transcript_40286/g.60429 Transcript_40286/m.60429 type:complete len:105 (-) Transcript_40286:83-397(-)
MKQDEVGCLALLPYTHHRVCESWSPFILFSHPHNHHKQQQRHICVSPHSFQFVTATSINQWMDERNKNEDTNGKKWQRKKCKFALSMLVLKWPEAECLAFLTSS